LRLRLFCGLCLDDRGSIGSSVPLPLLLASSPIIEVEAREVTLMAGGSNVAGQ
ncbi:hypothetical protein WUBG_03883, partial [Wuchereria bancrofti]